MTPPTALRWALILALSVLAAEGVSAQPVSGFSLQSSEVVPEGISAEVWDHALAAHQAATAAGRTTSLKLTIIDYSKPATEKRLWVVDVISRSVLQTEYVAHGEGSGGLLPTRFSNQDGTHQSSLGTFITGSTFTGIRGHSLRLHGLEPGINDNAYARGIVIHGTPGVSEAKARQGRMGRTEGCPAVSSEAARRLIALIAHGTVVFAWYPEPAFLQQSAFLDPEAVSARLGSGA